MGPFAAVLSRRRSTELPFRFDGLTRTLTQMLLNVPLSVLLMKPFAPVTFPRALGEDGSPAVVSIVNPFTDVQALKFPLEKLSEKIAAVPDCTWIGLDVGLGRLSFPASSSATTK